MYPAERPRCALTLACLAALATLTLGASEVQADTGGSVRYSYEKVSVAGVEQWVLVPRAELSLATSGSKPKKGTVIEAFNLLKRKKSTSYGDAKIRISSGRWPDKARVHINIDGKYARYAPIVMSEVTYTLTELGVPGVEFPGYADGLVTRADIPFGVYTLTLPMWQALPPGDAAPSQVMLPDGTTLDAQTFYTRWKKKDDALVGALYTYLKSPNSATAIYVMRKLPELGVPYVEAVVPMLSHDNSTVRSEALKVLDDKRGEDEVLEAVAARLEAEQSPSVAAQMAAFLGKSKEESFAVRDPLWRLDNLEDPKKVAAAAAELAKYDELASKVVPALVKKLKGGEEVVAEAAITSLEKLDADAAQIAALKDDAIPTPRQLAIARDLSRDSEVASKVAGYTFLGKNAPEREAVEAIATLAKMKDEAGRRAAEGFLTDSTDWRTEAAAAALAEREDPASLAAFAAALKAGGDRAPALEQAAYKIMVNQPLEAIETRTKDKNNLIQRLAYRAIGERALKEKAGGRVFETLKEGASSRDPMIRGASARALAAYANDEAAAVLGELAKDRSAQVRRDVALALGAFKAGVMTDTLVGYLEDEDPGVKAAAAASLGERGEALAWDTIEELARKGAPEVRASSFGALAKLTSRDDQQTVREVINLLGSAVNDDSIVVRKAALDQLGTFKDENAVLSIASQLGAEELEVRIVALRALGSTGHPSATELITDALSDPSRKVRQAAVRALADLGDKSARSELEARIAKEEDEELESLMRQTLKKL